MLPIFLTIENDSDREKAEEIYRRYSGTMLYVAEGILRERQLAEDAVSEAFVKIIRHLDKIDLSDCNRTRGFVVIVVRNTALNMLRERNRTVPLHDLGDCPDTAEPVFDHVSAKEACDRIADAVAALHKSYSDILYLKAVLEYSNQEIAEILSISPENVKIRLFRARSALKRQLMKEGDFCER